MCPNNVTGSRTDNKKDNEQTFVIFFEKRKKQIKIKWFGIRQAPIKRVFGSQRKDTKIFASQHVIQNFCPKRAKMS